MIQEINRDVSSGYVALLALLLATGMGIFALVKAIQAQSVVQTLLLILVLTAISVAYAGFFMVNPNEARVLQLFGKYMGTVKRPGLRYANPFYIEEARVTARAKLRDREAEGERRPR